MNDFHLTLPGPLRVGCQAAGRELCCGGTDSGSPPSPSQDRPRGRRRLSDGDARVRGSASAGGLVSAPGHRAGHRRVQVSGQGQEVQGRRGDGWRWRRQGVRCGAVVSARARPGPPRRRDHRDRHVDVADQPVRTSGMKPLVTYCGRVLEPDRCVVLGIGGLGRVHAAPATVSWWRDDPRGGVCGTHEGGQPRRGRDRHEVPFAAGPRRSPGVLPAAVPARSPAR